MRRMLFCTLFVSAMIVGICGCAHVDPDTKDPLGSMTKLPVSASAAYIPQSSSLSGLEDLNAEEGQSKGNRDFAQGILNLSDCIRIGLESNSETRSTWQALQSAAARVGEQQSAYFPEVDFTTGAIREKQVSFQSIQSKQQSSADNLFTTAFALNYLLFDGGQRSARVSGARADVQSTGFQHNTALQSVALKIEQSYYALLAARWARQVAEETVHNAEYHVRLAQARFNAGLAPRSDVLKAETSRADAELSLVSARNLVRIGRRGTSHRALDSEQFR